MGSWTLVRPTVGVREAHDLPQVERRRPDAMGGLCPAGAEALVVAARIYARYLRVGMPPACHERPRTRSASLPNNRRRALASRGGSGRWSGQDGMPTLEPNGNKNRPERGPVAEATQRPSQAAPTPRPWRTYAGPACNRTPNAFVTLRIVAKLGLPSSLKAR